MNYEDVSKTKHFQDLLKQIPEQERSKVEQAMKMMIEDFNDKVLKPLETITKK